MTNLRKAAEMALDALEDIFGKEKKDVGAIQTLRQALSNEFNPDWDQIEALQESLREHMAEIQRLRQALAQPVKSYCGGKPNYCIEPEDWVKQKELLKQGWRQCAIGQRTTQYCGMAEQARLEERKACAKLCEAMDCDGVMIAKDCAAAIRARSEK